MNQRHPEQVDLPALLESPSFKGLQVKFLTQGSTRVESVALVAGIDEVTTVRADTLVVVADDPGLGPWMISAALRYAWERRAAGLIVPENRISDVETALAERLDVSLLGASGDTSQTAIELAMRLGVAKAGALGRATQFGQRISGAPSLDAALATIADELGEVVPRLESADGLSLSAPADDSAQEPGNDRLQITVPLHSADAGGQRLRVEVWPHEAPYARRVLEVAAPIIRALVAETQLLAMRRSLPAISLPSLVGQSRPWQLTPPDLAEDHGATAWFTEEPRIAVCILTKERKRVGAAVHQRWLVAAPGVPLARTSDGWVAFVPLPTPRHLSDFARRLTEAFGSSPLPDVSIGYSERATLAPAAASALKEAWLAARAAGATPLSFSALTVDLLPRLLPRDLALELAQSLLPGLMTDVARDELIQAVVAFLAAKGSVTGAAKELGVHRNTLQARVRRAEELGVELSRPQAVLPMHLLLQALNPSASTQAP